MKIRPERPARGVGDFSPFCICEAAVLNFGEGGTAVFLFIISNRCSKNMILYFEKYVKMFFVKKNKVAEKSTIL